MEYVEVINAVVSILVLLGVWINTGVNIVYRKKEKLCQCKRK